MEVLRNLLIYGFAVIACLIAGQARATAGLGLGQATGAPGDTVELVLTLASDQPLSAWQADVVYDPAMFSAATLVPSAPSGMLPASETVAPGHLRIVVYAPACTGSEAIQAGVATLRLTIATHAADGTALVGIEQPVFAAVGGTIAPIGTLTPGQVRIHTVQVQPVAAIPVPTGGNGTWLLLTLVVLALGVLAIRRYPQQTRMMMMAAFATFIIVGSQTTFAAPIAGDANGDGRVDAQDAALIVEVILGRASAAGNADCNGDGVVDALDIACVIAATCATPGNHAPVLGNIGNQSLREDQLLTHTLTASDPDVGDELRFSLMQAPTGMSVDAQTGNLLWAPTHAQLGSHTVTARVTDAAGAFDEGSFNVSISKLGRPPVLAAIDNQGTEQGNAVSVTATASDPDLPGDTLTFALAMAPTGASINPASGTIAWTPSAAQIGRHDFTVKVSDAEGLMDFTSFIVTVAAINRAPVANDDVYVVRQGDTLTVPAAGVLVNDSDANGDPLTAELVTSPTNGELSFQPNGAFIYLPHNPDTALVTPNLDLTKYAGAVPNVSSESGLATYTPDRAIDGNLDTSWLPAPGSSNDFYEVTFANPATVREIRYFGNRISPLTAIDFTSGTFTLYDGSGAELWNSGDVTLPAPDRDVVLDLELLAGAPVANVSRVRFDVTGYEQPAGVYHGFAELQVIGDGVVVGLGLKYKWGWPSLDPTVLPAVEPTYAYSIGSPIVCDLDRDGIPEVLFGTYTGGSSDRYGVLRVVSGLDGSPVFTIKDPDPGSDANPGTASNLIDISSASIACGELDGEDLQREIVVVGNANELIALEHDGTFKWAVDYAGISGPVLVDLDADGTTEVVAGYGNGVVVLNGEDGSEVWTAQGGSAQIYGPAPLVADVDLNGSPDIVAGNTVYSATGAVLWQNTSLPDRVNAIGNFDDDAFAEIVLVGYGNIYLLEHDLSIKWGPITIPGGGHGGPPTIADFDGDGLAEIGVASQSYYVVFDTDGTILWQAPIHDTSSSITGSTVFDFDNDGVAEVVYRDEVNLWVFRGTDGEVIAKEPMGSGTLIEYPVVVDVDADGHAEILVGANNYYGDAYLPNHGFFAFEGIAGNWVRARSIWNQYNYHVTNVLADGSIPTHEQPNWLTAGLNNFRQNAFLPNEATRADQFTYRVSDGTSTSAAATVLLDIRPPNTAPSIISAPDRLATAGFEYLYDVVATDVDTDPLSFALVDGPAGMTIDVNTGLVRWSPAIAELGNHSVAVSVTDDDGFSDAQAWQITVAEPVSVPDVIGQSQAAAETAISSAGLATGVVSQAHYASVPIGQVFLQSPLGGSAAEPGSDVDIVTSMGPEPGEIDDDGDGFTENEGDCNDVNPSIYPGAPEVGGDGIDQDCDGADARLPVDRVVLQPPSLNLRVGESFDLVAHGVYTDGSGFRIDQRATWASSDPAIASVGNSGLVTGLASGSANITASFEGKTDSTSVQVTLVDSSDQTPPEAAITAPLADASVLEPVQVTGTANDANLVRWELSMAPADSDTYTQIAIGTTAVVDGVLGTLDPTLLLNDLYRLRLQVFDAGLNVSTLIVPVQVEGQQKLGAFTLAFTDLEIPVAGTPITVNRHYDSRDQRVGDFGVGWRLGVQSLELTCNAPLGMGWYVAHSGLAFGLLPTRAHVCMLRLPSGTVEVFDFTPSPTASAIVPFPFGSIQAGFTARHGTLGKLEALTDGTLSILDAQPGPVSLLRGDNEAYNPDRFRYTSTDGTTLLFGPGGLEALTDANGNTLSFGPGSIIHSAGRSIAFTRDALGRITQVTDPMGNSQSYAYSTAGDLVAHTDAGGNTTRFFYNNTHGLLRVDDPLGRPRVRTQYDADGRVVSVTDAAGNAIAYQYDLNAGTQTTIDPLGHSSTLAFDPRGNVLRQETSVTIEGIVTPVVSSHEYDDLDNETLSLDADGRRTERTFNADGYLTGTTLDPAGQALSMHTTYDDGGNPLTRTDSLGQASQYSYDARGNATRLSGPASQQLDVAYAGNGVISRLTNALGHRYEMTQTAFGQRASQRQVDASGALLAETTFTYDANGRVLTRAETRLVDGLPQQVSTSYSYDASGRVLALIDALGGVTRYEYDAVGNRVAMIDPLGDRTGYQYDARGLLVRTRLADGSELRTEYDAAGRRVRDIDAQGHVTRYEYDELGRLLRTTAANGGVHSNVWSPGGRLMAEIDALGKRTDYAYDAVGQRVSTTLPEVIDGVTGNPARPVIHFEYDAGGHRTAVIDPLGRRTEYAFDARGRPVKVRFADGSENNSVFNAASQQVQVSDEDGLTTDITYDGSNRPVRVLEPAADGGSPRPETLFTYYQNNQLQSTTDALGHTTRFGYDALGRPRSQTLPAGQQQTFEYDAAGHMVRKVDFTGQARTSSYDARGRLLALQLPGGETYSFTYTPDSQLASATDDRGSTSYAWDALGRRTAITQPDGQTLAYERDLLGQVVAMTANGRRVTYDYDALGRLLAVHSPDVSDACAQVPCTTQYAYDLAGQRVRTELPNGVVTRFTHDLRGRVLTLEVRDASNNVIERYASTYSASGRRLSLTTMDGAVVTYAYDGRGRLIREQGTGSLAYVVEYGYDAVGNRVRVVENGVESLATYDVNDRLLSMGAVSYAYDANGNRVQRAAGADVTAYQWDDQGRLAGVTHAGDSVSYDYDTAGRLVQRSDASGSTDFLVDPESVSGFDQIVAESAAGTPQASYTWGRGLIVRSAAGVSRYVGRDPHNSTALLTGSNGSATDSFRYDAYGKLLARSGTSAMRHRYAGEMYDEDAGAYYLRARFYDPQTGGFLSADSNPVRAGSPASLPRYQYAGGDPVNFVDPLGRFSVAEVSVTQSISAAMNFGKRAFTAFKGICKAKGTVKTLDLVTGLGNVVYSIASMGTGGSFGLDNEKFSFKAELPVEVKIGSRNFQSVVVSGESSYSSPWTAAFKIEGSSELGIKGVQFSEGADAAAGKVAFGIEFSNGQPKLSGGIAIGTERRIIDVEACGFGVASVFGSVEAGVSGTGNVVTGAMNGSVALGGKVKLAIPNGDHAMIELEYPIFELKGDTSAGYSGTILGRPVRPFF